MFVLESQLGLHVSSAGSLDLAFDRALEIGATTFQIFTRNPNQWKFKPIPEDVVAAFREKRRKSGFRRVVDHMPYLPNLASSEKTILKQSRDALDAEVKRCDALGIDYLVIHLGSHKGGGTMMGVRNISDAVNEALAGSDGDTMVLLENMAGQKNSVGARFEELMLILDRVKRSDRTGVCFDSCLPPGSPVLVNGTPVPIENVEVGDSVTSLDGCSTAVLRTMRREYAGQLVLIKPEGLPWLTMTSEHPVLYTKVDRIKYLEETPWRIKLTSQPTWLAAGELKQGGYLVMPVLKSLSEVILDFRRYTGLGPHRKVFPPTMPLTEELAELLGLYLAEGFTFMARTERGDRGKVYLAFGKHEKELIEKTIRLFERIFGLRAWTDEGETVVKVCIASNVLARFLKENFGPNAREKKIPSFIMFGPTGCVRSFLLGYLAGDGCVDDSGIRFTTTSTTVASQLIHLLARLDMRGTISAHNSTTSEISGRTIRGRGWFTVRVGRADSRKLGLDFYLPTMPQRTILRSGGFYYIPIGSVRRDSYQGQVVNLTTDSGSFLAPFVATHNCHAYAAGFDLTNEGVVERTMGLFDQCVGYDRLRVVHLNDSRGALGSNLDRHENIGKGKIGTKGMRAFLHYKGVAERPLIMETPYEDVRGMKHGLATVRRLLK